MNKNHYYYWASYRRKMLDFLQEKYRYLYEGVILDIGGRDRGKFIKSRDKNQKWIFADINKEYNPDIILDVTNMEQIEADSIDVINAIELFEHVKNIKLGLKECLRVLKKEGIIIISVPFLYHIHADPNDFQRWTFTKWKLELKKLGFKIEKFIVMGKFFLNFAENLKNLIKAIKKSHSLVGSLLLKACHPLLDKITKLDNKPIVKKDSVLRNYHNGYFIIAKKEN